MSAWLFERKKERDLERYERECLIERGGRAIQVSDIIRKCVYVCVKYLRERRKEERQPKCECKREREREIKEREI